MGMIKKLLIAIPIIIFFKAIGMGISQSVMLGVLLVVFVREPKSQCLINRLSYLLAILEFGIYYQNGIIESLNMVNNLIRGMVGAFI